MVNRNSRRALGLPAATDPISCSQYKFSFEKLGYIASYSLVQFPLSYHRTLAGCGHSKCQAFNNLIHTGMKVICQFFKLQ